MLTDSAPLVRGAAVWALSRLLEGSAFRDLARSAARGEADAGVAEEWTEALAALEPADL